MVYFKDIDISNIKGSIIFLDIDGTLVPDGAIGMDLDVKEKVNILSKDNILFLCTNSENVDRTNKFKLELGIRSVSGKYKKPSPKLLKLALELIPKSDNEIKYKLLVIGDKYIIDGRFAKKIKADFIKVDSFVSKNESLVNRFIYWLDRIYGSKLR